MGKFYLDTEFHEFNKPVKLLGIPLRRVETIDLISIGIVSENGREYYAICNEFDLEEAWKNQWLRENVLKSIHKELCAKVGVYGKTYHPNVFEPFTQKSMRFLLKSYGKSKRNIANEILHFIGQVPLTQSEGTAEAAVESTPPEFYAYFADYDWVVFCWLFGRMIDLPKGFPFYCMDLKQMMVENGLGGEWKQINCPDPVNEHNALADAKWNRKLHKQIKLKVQNF